jgi:hypothetical protein
MSTGSQRLLGAPPGIAPGGGGDPRRAAQASAVALRRRVGLEPQGKRAVGPPLRRPEAAAPYRLPHAPAAWFRPAMPAH